MAEVVYLGLGPVNNPPDSVTPPNETAQILPANLDQAASVQYEGPVLPPGNPDVNFFRSASQGGQAVGVVATVNGNPNTVIGVTGPADGPNVQLSNPAVSSGSIPVAYSAQGLFVNSTVFPVSLSNCTGIGTSGAPSAVIRLTPTLEILLG